MVFIGRSRLAHPHHETAQLASKSIDLAFAKSATPKSCMCLSRHSDGRAVGCSRSTDRDPVVTRYTVCRPTFGTRRFRANHKVSRSAAMRRHAIGRPAVVVDHVVYADWYGHSRTIRPWLRLTGWRRSGATMALRMPDQRRTRQRLPSAGGVNGGYHAGDRPCGWHRAFDRMRRRRSILSDLILTLVRPSATTSRPASQNRHRRHSAAAECRECRSSQLRKTRVSFE